MSKSAIVETKSVFYECPNGCHETWFFQEGNSPSIRKMTETGDIIEYEHFDFEPTQGSVVKCYKCRAEAIIKTRKVRTTITIE